MLVGATPMQCEFLPSDASIVRATAAVEALYGDAYVTLANASTVDEALRCVAELWAHPSAIGMTLRVRQLKSARPSYVLLQKSSECTVCTFAGEAQPHPALAQAGVTYSLRAAHEAAAYPVGSAPDATSQAAVWLRQRLEAMLETPPWRRTALGRLPLEMQDASSTTYAPRPRGGHAG